MAHLFRYDSNYGRYHGTVEVRDGNLIVDGDEIKALAERDPAKLPWGDLGVDLVIESTGIFTDKDSASKHITGGAKKVIISAPAKNEDITICLGVNEDKYDPATHHVVSNASCTTNCLAPAAKIVHEHFGIQKAFMTTIHSYTNDQQILDLPHKDLRRARAAALNIIPTTTGAAKAVALVLPDLKGKFDGIAVRVPTPTVSLVDFVAVVDNPTNKADLIAAFDEAANGALNGILGVAHEPLVSMDFKGDPRSSIVDAEMSDARDNLVKVITWYDNEWGYSVRVADLTKYMGVRMGESVTA
jgi:glyceraldehyde 3-phosphate dehydrogenase